MLSVNHFIVTGIAGLILTGCQAGSFLSGRGPDASASGDGVAILLAGGNSSAISDNILAAPLLQRLDERDVPRAKQAQATALQQQRGGMPIAWHNPDTGHSGRVVSGPGYSINNRQCRDYIHTITVDGAEQVEKGVACRTRDGAWQPIPS